MRDGKEGGKNNRGEIHNFTEEVFFGAVFLRCFVESNNCKENRNIL